MIRRELDKAFQEEKKICIGVSYMEIQHGKMGIGNLGTNKEE